MKIAVVVIHFGSAVTTQNCLSNLKNKLSSHQLILINNSPREIATLQKIIPGTKLINNQSNVGFARAVNQGIVLGLADPAVTHILLLNNDLEIESGSLAELLSTFNKDKSAGLVAPLLRHAKGYDWGGKYRRVSGMVKHVNWENKPKTMLFVDHVAGAAMLISREVVEKVGYFDERFFLYYEDLDYCLRVKQAGYSIRINPAVVMFHRTSASSRLIVRTLYQWRSHLLFVAKYLPSTALPTALVWDLVFYPLFVIKSLFQR